MPFKIIETIEKGQKRLCIIPSFWESNGILRWPKKRLDINILVKDEFSQPVDNWSSSDCCVKRQLLSSYDEATRELDLMLQNSDTEFDNQAEVITTNNNINFSDYNTLAGQLALNQPEKSLTSSTATTSTRVLPTTAAEYVIQFINDSDVATQSTNFETQIPTQIQQNTDVNQIENHLKLILDNQINMTQTINVLKDNQKKILHKLASLSVQIDYEFSKCPSDHTKNTDVVTLGKSNEFENDTFVIKPIDSVKELEELESLLTDKQQKNKLLKQYSFVCSQSDGRGGTCAYKILDMFFTRDFLCKCSWTGGSRGSDNVKNPLKAYKNVLKFYYELIHTWDQTYTIENNEDFFKTVLKNSVKRKLSKNERASTKRRRTKKDTLKNSNQTNQTTNQVESVMIVADDDVTNKTKNTTEDVTEEREEDEEEEESLC